MAHCFVVVHLYTWVKVGHEPETQFEAASGITVLSKLHVTTPKELYINMQGWKFFKI